MSKKPEDSAGRRGLDPGPDVPDPSPWDGQVGEGAVLPSTEVISHLVRELEHPEIIEREKERKKNK